MKFKLTLLIILCKLNNATGNQQNKGSPIFDKCHTEFLDLYNIKLSENKVVKSNNCFDLEHSCCHNEVEKNLLLDWNKNYKEKFENQYSNYLKMLNYTMGYYNSYKTIATEIMENNLTTDNCHFYAKKFIDLELNNDKIKIIIDKIFKRIEYISSYKKGFYCNICNSDIVKYIKKDIKHGHFDIRLSSEFCNVLVSNSIESIYDYNFILLRYFKYVIELTSCKLKDSKSYESLVTFNTWTDSKIQNCYKHNKDFIHCEKICDDFKLGTWSDMFDGNLKEVKAVYEFIINNENDIFKTPTNHNYKKNDRIKIKEIIKNINNDGIHDHIINNKAHKNNNIKTHFALDDGFHPKPYNKNNTNYNLEIKYSEIYKIIIALYLFFN